ncbi:MAG: methylated-DNA--[protein]-cysteine S-methyltransferase [Nevskia sp.]|nr:methylated-DNA--[protein]-cysteine S-methyltransferase [Nevskia sp.]
MREIMRYARGHSSLGDIVVVASAEGLVAVEFGVVEPVLQALRDRFPGIAIIADHTGLEPMVEAVVNLIEDPQRACELPLDPRGTEFELRVWRALRDIPRGHTASYGEIAARLGSPRLAREVGAACAANTLAVLVPCHRVLKKDGALSGYRWGTARKRALLQREASA